MWGFLKEIRKGCAMRDKNTNLREALIIAGIKEINVHGVSGFSIRRVAENCNVSCAAPYRHFESKESALEFLKEVFESDTAMLVKASHAMEFEWLVERLSK